MCLECSNISRGWDQQLKNFEPRVSPALVSKKFYEIVQHFRISSKNICLCFADQVSELTHYNGHIGFSSSISFNILLKVIVHVWFLFQDCSTLGFGYFDIFQRFCCIVAILNTSLDSCLFVNQKFADMWNVVFFVQY